MWPEPSPAVLREISARHPPGLPVLVHEVVGVPGFFDHAGPNKELALASLSMLPSAHLQERRRPDCIFSELNSPPRLSSVYASLCTSRYQRKTQGRVDRYSFLEGFFLPASCRFIPAQSNRHFSSIDGAFSGLPTTR